MKRLLISPVEKAAPVLRTGEEWVDDSADVLLSELADLLKRSTETRPTFRPARSDDSSPGEDVLDVKLTGLLPLPPLSGPVAPLPD